MKCKETKRRRRFWGRKCKCDFFSAKKANGETESSHTNQGAGDSLAVFCERLRDLCGNYGDGDGQVNEPSVHTQTKHALALATEFGLLREPEVSWEEFLSGCPDAIIGTEHMVELDAKTGLVSFGVTQPQYHGVPAEPREIEAFFLEAGWTCLNDPSGHAVFFNYAFGMIAIDAEKRNCYINKAGL